MKTFQEKLADYAKLAVKMGLNVQPNQVCYIRAEVGTTEFVQLVTKEAYLAGAKQVHINYYDAVIERTRFELAPDESFLEFPDWERETLEQLRDQGACFLVISSTDPDLLGGIPPERVANDKKVQGKALENWYSCINANKNSWTVIGAASEGWARKVFPNDENCVEKLWDEIFEVCRINTPDPLQAWIQHKADLRKRLTYLNEKKYTALHYTAKGTDLTVGLHPTHVWEGVDSENRHGHTFTANMPTEEVFTVPDRNRVNGVVASTKPLSYAGSIIDNFSLRFKDGRVVEVKAEQGEELLKTLIETDEGSHYLGEAALVSYDSPISKSNILFYNTLFDENASNHFAVGSGYPSCVEGGTEMSKEELEAVGVNQSLTHVDFMVGAADMNIDGILPDGTREPIFRNGNWAF